jgi:uncharacterized membrane protein
MKSQPTILGLMGFIGFIAVGMAALRTNDELWAAAIFALTILTLCTAALVAIYRRGALGRGSRSSAMVWRPARGWVPLR